jgi:nitrate reductase NapAB chaperone NapD
MNISGILVVAAPGQTHAVIAQLVELEGVEVDRAEPETGRIGVVQQAPDVGAEVAGFARIRAVAGVLSADLVCHYFGEQPRTEPDPESALAQLSTPRPDEATPRDAGDAPSECAPSNARTEP